MFLTLRTLLILSASSLPLGKPSLGCDLDICTRFSNQIIVQLKNKIA